MVKLKNRWHGRTTNGRSIPGTYNGALPKCGNFPPIECRFIIYNDDAVGEVCAWA